MSKTIRRVGDVPIEALGTEGRRAMNSVRRTTPAEVARTCLMLCELADDEDQARELVDSIVGSDPERRAAVRAELVGLERGKYAATLFDRIAGKVLAR